MERWKGHQRQSTVALAFRGGEIPSDGGGNQQRPGEEVGATAGLALEGQIGIPSCLEAEGRVSQACGQCSKAKRGRLERIRVWPGQRVGGEQWGQVAWVAWHVVRGP